MLQSSHPDGIEARLRTQKAKGVWNMSYLNIKRFGLRYFDGFSMFVYPHQVRPVFSAPDYSVPFPVFARPAPTRPRHGFVESRLVHSWQELAEIYAATAREDPQGEVIIMPPLDGAKSAVATNAGVTWSLGNDGATSGKAGITIPAAASSAAWRSALGMPNDYTAFAVGISETPYLELVSGDCDAIYAVQVRDGPEQATAVDFIPRIYEAGSYTAVSVNPAGLDLLEWEKRVEGFADPEQTVVFLTSGGLSSHVAVHLIQRGIAAVTSIPATTAVRLEPSEGSSAFKPTDAEASALAAAIRQRFAEDYIASRDVSDHLRTALGTAHTQHIWPNSPLFTELRAHSVVTLLRTLTAAYAGELRHKNSDDEYPYGEPIETFLMEGNYGRSSIYSLWLSARPLSDLISAADMAEPHFSDDGWADSYGGETWGNIVASTHQAAIALRAFLDEPTAETWHSFIGTIHAAVNLAHNTGWVLSKWLPEGYMTDVAHSPGVGFLNNIAANIAISHLNTEGH